MKTLYFIAFLLLATIINTSAQAPKNRVLSIPVERNGITLREPWAGGMNSPQFSMVDLNNDGIKDLFVFDRVGDKVMTFLNRGNASDTTFYYAPQYEELFPPELNNWALIRDYNNDGIPDIFTHGSAGIKVYKGRMVNNLLHFDVVSDLLLYNDGVYNVNIYTNIDDIPVITDVNHDGDLDVLTYGIFGSAIEYYENQTVEHAGDPHYAADSLKYVDVTYCWGNFTEAALTNSINLHASCKGGGHDSTIINTGGARHSGSTIYNFDYGHDGDVDLLIGDISYSNLVFVKNCGDSTFADICEWDSIFPVCDTPVIMPIFPAAFGVDANNDGLEDLLISPNARTGSRDINNVMFYRNTDDTSTCQFRYVTDSLIVHHALDFGSDSKPLFFDFNGDGLLDIVVGNYGYFRPFQTYKSAIAIYENIGTANSPKYRMRSDDYNDFSTYNLISMSPAFGDLDGDGKKDMVAGDLNGFVHYFKNTGTTQAAFPTMTIPQYFSIDVGQYSTPFIYDVNSDGLNDLVVGERDGTFNYFWNYGTATNAAFSMDSMVSNWGHISVALQNLNEGYSAPFITKDSANNILLYSGSGRGATFEFLIDANDVRNGTFTLIDSDLLKHDSGSESTISIADINNDGHMEYLVGNSRGGLLMYSDSVWDAGTTLAVNEIPQLPGGLSVFPNPAKDYFTCQLSNAEFQSPTVELFNVLGEKVVVEHSTFHNNLHINTSQLGKGVYFVRIVNAGKIYSAKVLIQ